MTQDPNTFTPPDYVRNHVVLPALAFIICIFIIEWFHIDVHLSQWLFHLEGGVDHWPLRQYWLTENVFHVGGRFFIILLGVIIIGFIIASFKQPKLKPYRKGLIFLLLSIATSLILVRLGKTFIHIDCPWDLKMFGGKAEYFSLFSEQPTTPSTGQCFPAGHSSSGYAWVALYFLALAYKREYRWMGLAFGITLGLAFGIAQQLRGAHFLSHDVWSLTLSWFSAASLHYFMFFRSSTSIGVESAVDYPEFRSNS
ncbi:phosphatase PAP2 family protein [Shewanella sp. Isolate11]|uniref:phosphatase PAP2 family protein n=1 Tax=Shewanella sp. Isolate11 TaxID=2908530 RepID=UPI001EFE3480|nr:phosphatase PAP2 family protein [Shewanella sp. Isolate11]MCG9695705.1 phosphatase PAP2 family protein [Shewanella sp. Isolate11]